jgi:hypothetical protein
MILKASRDAQAEVSTKLASGRCSARCTNCCGFRIRRSTADQGVLATVADHPGDGLLTVPPRPVSCSMPRDRDLIPSRSDRRARVFYDQGYGVSASLYKCLQRRPRALS